MKKTKQTFGIWKERGYFYEKKVKVTIGNTTFIKKKRHFFLVYWCLVFLNPDKYYNDPDRYKKTRWDYDRDE
jgi:hypothetical protein